ncbi:MAG: hypothetical protein HC880_11120 [Bacteroidia bacterium]|nr:hypothetical protein [Bacteroidia bacterium]
MEKGLGIEAEYYFSLQQEVALRICFPELDQLNEELRPITLDLPAITQENEYTPEECQQALAQGTGFLFWDNSFVIVKPSDPAEWTLEKAQDDARALLGFSIKNLPIGV